MFSIMLCLRTVFLFCIYTLSSCLASEYMSPDNLKIYHDITAGRGLYPDFKEIVNLNESNFRKLVFNNTKKNAWIIEFYNSWCGHCHRFSTTWKQLALDVNGWRDIITVGAVDCSSRSNTPLCRDFEIMFYPMIKYFPPLPANNFLGQTVKNHFGQELLNSVLSILRNEAKEGSINQPALLPFTGNSINSLWEGVSKEVVFTILVVQTNETFFGEGLALDMLKVKEVKVLTSFSNNTQLVKELAVQKYPSIFIIDRKNNLKQITFNDMIIDRKILYSAVKYNLQEQGLVVPDLKIEKISTEVNIDVAQIMVLMEVEEQIKKRLNLNDLSDVVFQVDLENAMQHSLTVEISSHKNISGEAMVALKNYVQMLANHFPIGKKGKSYFNYILANIESKNEISGSSFGEIEINANNLYKPYLSPKSSWVGCRGSEPKYRGYPCGLWMMFHTLTVQAYQTMTSDAKQVLRAMIGYVKHFFGCTDCAKHFLEMAVTFEGNVTTNKDSVLWLWKAHNSANKRLKSDPTEDPKHPKIIFPSRTHCPACYENGSWDEEQVLHFLGSMYTNIRYFLVEDSIPTTTSEIIMPQVMRHENVVEETGYNYSQSESKQMNFNFNIFDVSICVLLYVFSMVIILVICLKFLYKRTSRKKVYIYDIFQKV